MTGTDHTAVAESWLRSFASALDAKNTKAVSGVFGERCFWRDLLAFTWNIKTMEGRAAIQQMLEARLGDTKPSNWKLARMNASKLFQNQLYKTGDTIYQLYLNRIDSSGGTPSNNWDTVFTHKSK